MYRKNYGKRLITPILLSSFVFYLSMPCLLADTTVIQGTDPAGVSRPIVVDTSGRITLDPNSVGGGGGGGGGAVTQSDQTLLKGTMYQGGTWSNVGVTGTFWQSVQPVSGTFWQATQPVSLASVPLPTGASTAANQTNVQSSAGTAATTLIGVQGNASGVPVVVVQSAPALSTYVLASTSGTATLKGFYVDSAGVQLAADFTYSITSATTLTTLAGGTLPANSVGVKWSLSGANLYIGNSGQVNGSFTYTPASVQATIANYGTFGRVSP